MVGAPASRRPTAAAGQSAICNLQSAVFLVTDRRLVPAGDLIPAVSAAVAGGVGMVLLREKELPAGELLALAERLLAAIAGRALLVVNDRLDVALAAGAHGVHLGEAGLPVAAARRLALPTGFLVGRSVHSAEGAAAACAAGADYLLAGNVFETASHPGRPAAGLEFLRAVCAAAGRTPVFAIGGVTSENAGACIAAGAAGVAAISALLAAPDPQRAAEELLAAARTAADPSSPTGPSAAQTTERGNHDHHHR